MLLSMTGYGRGEAQIGARRVAVEVRSVNHRYCELSVRLPRVLQGLEGRIRELTQKRLSRGKITLAVTLDGAENDLGQLRVNVGAAESYLRAMRELQSKLSLGGQIEIASLLSLPDVLAWEQVELDEELAWKQCEVALERALEEIVGMKRREGENLAQDLKTRLKLIDDAIAAVIAQVPVMITAWQARLQARLAEISQDLEYNRLRLEAEIALFVDRTDCTEECVRLRSHLQQFDEFIASPEPVGRRLNFLLQEMNREANTIGSKAQDVAIARDVITVKEEIERIREQVQNFE